jgi:hypothetical protein
MAIVFILNCCNQSDNSDERNDGTQSAGAVVCFMLAGLALAFVAGLAIEFGFFRRLAALALTGARKDE